MNISPRIVKMQTKKNRLVDTYLILPDVGKKILSDFVIELSDIEAKGTDDQQLTQSVALTFEQLSNAFLVPLDIGPTCRASRIRPALIQNCMDSWTDS